MHKGKLYSIVLSSLLFVTGCSVTGVNNELINKNGENTKFTRGEVEAYIQGMSEKSGESLTHLYDASLFESENNPIPAYSAFTMNLTGGFIKALTNNSTEKLLVYAEIFEPSYNPDVPYAIVIDNIQFKKSMENLNIMSKPIYGPRSFKSDSIRIRLRVLAIDETKAKNQIQTIDLLANFISTLSFNINPIVADAGRFAGNILKDYIQNGIAKVEFDFDLTLHSGKKLLKVNKNNSFDSDIDIFSQTLNPLLREGQYVFLKRETGRLGTELDAGLNKVLNVDKSERDMTKLFVEGGRLMKIDDKGDYCQNKNSAIFTDKNNTYCSYRDNSYLIMSIDRSENYLTNSDFQELSYKRMEEFNTLVDSKFSYEEKTENLKDYYALTNKQRFQETFNAISESLDYIDLLDNSSMLNSHSVNDICKLMIKNLPHKYIKEDKIVYTYLQNIMKELNVTDFKILDFKKGQLVLNEGNDSTCNDLESIKNTKKLEKSLLETKTYLSSLMSSALEEDLKFEEYLKDFVIKVPRDPRRVTSILKLVRTNWNHEKLRGKLISILQKILYPTPETSDKKKWDYLQKKLSDEINNISSFIEFKSEFGVFLIKDKNLINNIMGSITGDSKKK